jgi:acyl transferase domain-containing protein/aryl carrier-like protein
MNEPTAIIGMAVHLPDADTLDELHANLRDGRDSVRTVPEERLRMAGADPATPHQLLAPIGRVAEFDHEFFGISLREAELMDPHHRLTLQLACAAVEDAGYALSSMRGGRGGLVIAAPRLDYAELIDDADDGLPAMLGNTAAALAGRISYLLGAQGHSVVLDTGCSSGLVAVDHALRLLRAGDADTVLTGGLSVRSTFTSLTDSERYAEVMASSGRCRAFDADADGTGDGEGGVMLLLKPLARAVRDGDHVHAVLLGSAVNHNGYRSNSLGAPSPGAQTELLRTAWQKAGIEPGSIGYIETHGSGTRLGDLIEAEALDQALTAVGPRPRPCPIGSVKTNVGHLDQAAGLVGLAKTVLSLRHGALYPSLHFDRPNPLIGFETRSIRVNASLRPWERRGDEPRMAGVSSLSLTGTNAHVVLQEAERPSPPPSVPGEGIVTVSAKTQRALTRYCERLYEHLTAHPDLDPGDVLHVLNRGRDHHRHRLAFPARSLADMTAGLRRAARRLGRGPESADPVRRALVLVVSPDSELTKADADRLAARHPVFADALRRCREALPDSAADLMWFARRYALWCLLSSLGMRPDAVIGGGAALPLARLVRGELDLAAALRSAAVPAAAADHATEPIPLEGALAVCELGPAGSLLRAAPPGSAGLDVRGDGVLHCMAGLYAAGADLDWDRAHETAEHRRIPLPTYPFEPTRCWYREIDDAVPDQNPAPAASADPVEAGVGVPRPDVSHYSLADCERILAGVWEEVLKAPAVDPDSDYFAIGGNSIMGLQVVARLWRDLGIRIRLPDLYTHPTVRGLAALVHRALSDASGAAREGIERADRGQRLPLSFGQESLWFIDRLSPGSWAYNVPLDLHVLGPLDPTW